MDADAAVAYARRSRGERKRPTTGWAALTPTELDVARLAGRGLTNPDIGRELFVQASRTGCSGWPAVTAAGHDTACARALEVEVINVGLIERMLSRGLTEIESRAPAARGDDTPPPDRPGARE